MSAWRACERGFCYCAHHAHFRHLHDEIGIVPVALLGVAEDRALAPLGEVAALALQPFGIDVVNALVRI
jgi:hypothetical protein